MSVISVGILSSTSSSNVVMETAFLEATDFFEENEEQGVIQASKL